MKKIFTLFAAAMMAVSTMAETKTVTIYSWESPEGTPIETGGTIAYVNGENVADTSKPSRLNYLNSGYYTICLNGKKANLDETEPSANAGHMELVLSNGETFKAGDKIVMTAYYSKGEEKKVSAYIKFENGADVTSALVSQDLQAGGSPEEITVVVPEEAAGSKSLKMTRGDGGTNMFIIKLVISGDREVTALQNVNATSSKAGKKMVDGKLVIEKDGVMYNVLGQKM